MTRMSWPVLTWSRLMGRKALDLDQVRVMARDQHSVQARSTNYEDPDQGDADRG